MFKKQIERLIEELKLMGIKDEKVLEVIKKIPRHKFILENYLSEAYANYPLSIGYNQTISQPYTVAFMLQSLELKKNDKVLEIGTGSGWNAALISEIVKPGKVYTTEIIKELVEFAKKNLKDYKNVKVIYSDGSQGLKEYEPYSKIIVTAGCPEIPKPLIEQLKPNGILVAPVGSYSQKMLKITKNKQLKIQELGDFVFVPLKGKFGFS